MTSSVRGLSSLVGFIQPTRICIIPHFIVVRRSQSFTEQLDLRMVLTVILRCVWAQCLLQVLVRGISLLFKTRATCVLLNIADRSYIFVLVIIQDTNIVSNMPLYKWIQ